MFVKINKCFFVTVPNQSSTWWRENTNFSGTSWWCFKTYQSFLYAPFYSRSLDAVLPNYFGKVLFSPEYVFLRFILTKRCVKVLSSQFTGRSPYLSKSFPVFKKYFFRETHGTGVKYHSELAKQLSSFLEKVIEVNICRGVFRSQLMI